MEPTTTNRTFSAGSRQAPDPYDQFLEHEGFYRKHTARDSTCLFRVVSEQVFDVQLYHDKVRADCVQFMRQSRHQFEKKINGDYDEYLDEMSKFRSYGTFIELNALAHAYRRNVLLFEPYNCGRWFVKCDSYEETLMVFFSPDKHFDSIFPTTFIEQAAYCQALVYEVLYVRVFKLPDVMYSVERMLHDPEGRAIQIVEGTDKNGDFVEEKIITSDGRQFFLDAPEDTECVLDNYRLCHFHNRENFAHIADVYRSKRSDKIVKEIRNVHSNGLRGGSISRELVLVNPMLCEKTISCVRQLLKEGITPFPYKVAKALDPHIYRNIEFDSWSDIRRELKYRSWYFSGIDLQVGARCLVKLNDHDDRLLHGYIQEMKPHNGPCIVYLEELAECRSVPYEKLRTLAADHSKPWSFPYRPRRISEEKTAKRKFQSKFLDMTKSKHIDDDLKGYMTCCGTDKSCCYTISQHNGLHDFRVPQIEMVVMPFKIDDNNSQKTKHVKTELNKSDKTESQTETDNTDCSSSGFYESYSTSSVHGNNPLYCYSYSDTFPYDATATTFYSQPYPPQPCAYAAPGSYSCPFYGPLGSVAAVAPNAALPAVRFSEGVPNFNASQSVVPSGSDMPLNDLATLRYFYNLGIEYFRQNQFRMLPPPVPLYLDMGYAPDIAESVNNEGHSVNDLENDFERKLNISSSNVEHSTNSQPPKQRGTGFGTVKNDNHQRKHSYTTKNPIRKIPEQKTVRSRATISEHSVSPVLSSKQSPQVDNYNSHDSAQLQTYSYGPAVPAINPYPVGVQLYTYDPPNMDPMMPQQGTCYVPTYVVHPYGTVMTPSSPGGIVAPPPQERMMHENLPTSPVDNRSEAQHGPQYGTHYPPMMYGPPQRPQGYTIWGYPQTQPICNSVNSNNENGNNDSGNVTQ